MVATADSRNQCMFTQLPSLEERRKPCTNDASYAFRFFWGCLFLQFLQPQATQTTPLSAQGQLQPVGQMR